MTKGEATYAQLQAAGLLRFVLTVKVHRTCVRGVFLTDVLPALRGDCYDEVTNPEGHFREGPFSWLHPEIDNATEFRGEQDAFGPESSMQIVINQVTGEFYADLDRWASYQDLRGTFGHLVLEVAVPHTARAAKRVWRWLRRRKEECSEDVAEKTS